MSQEYSIKECLRGYTNAALGAICERWQLAAATKPSRIRAIEKVLRDPLHVTRVLERLSPVELRVLALISERPEAEVADILAVPALFGDGKTEAILKETAQTGLILACPHDRSGAFSFSDLSHDHFNGNGNGAVITVPGVVARQLPAPGPLGIVISPTKTSTKPDAPASADKATSAFLETLRMVDVLMPRVTAAGTIHKADVARAREAASNVGVSVDGLRLSLMMARQIGCVQVKNGRLVTNEKAGQWATSSAADRVRGLWQAYIASEEIPDLRLFFPQLAEALEEHLPEGSLRRRYHKMLVAQILSEQEEDRWYPVEGFVNLIRRADSNVLFLEERWRALQSHAREVTSAWRDRSWQTHERRLFYWMIQNLLASAGMVELGDEGRLFRLTQLGRYALGVGEAPSEVRPARQDAVVVQPDFEVVAYMDRCPPELRWKLDTFCERAHGEQVRTYRLTQESVYRGVRAGSSTAAFVHKLKTHSSRPLPENVEHQLASWERKLESITVRTGCRVVECLKAKEARALASQVPESRLIGDRYVLVPQNASLPKDEESIEWATIDYAQPMTPCLEQGEGVRLCGPWNEWNLFVRRRLDEVGNVKLKTNGDLAVELGADFVKKDKDWGLLAAQLEALAKEPLADRYRVALRAWCGDVAAAQSTTATLVRFDDAETCQAALELAEGAACVEGRLGLFTVVVRQGTLTKFKRALKAHGIKVSPASRLECDGPPDTWATQWVETQRTHEEPAEPEAPTSKRERSKRAQVAQEALPSYSPRIVREILQDAIERRKPVLIQYQSRWSQEASVRRVNPVSLDVYGAFPSLSGFCHQHGGARTFRLARISGIRVLEDETF
ncbi:MAG: WYL domain-containing protein [bacterium]|nr:WYL domain-containing protein [bacterium]